MKNDFDNAILNMAQTTPEPEDYTGEDGLLYCGKCRKPKPEPDRMRRIQHNAG